ncbi:MAG: hypothetical protein JST79_04030 [Acidobacteria bacterium]|nr:hypothetical protein [Acidobacteriota bacterium]
MKIHDSKLGWTLVLLGALLLLWSGKLGLLIVVAPAAALLAWGITGESPAPSRQRRLK